MAEILIERTGKSFSIASNQYKVTFPDGSFTFIWSPPWNDYTPGEEDAGALAHAMKMWNDLQDEKVRKGGG